jgi:prepilin-type N-terminal cleavage/methylation domain-containing protein
VSAPATTAYAIRACPRRAGLSLVEVMISLAISAMLLTAVATAFVASSSAIEANDQFVRAAQAARISVNHIMNDVRRAQIPAAGTSGLVEDERLELTSDAGVKRTYTLSGKDLMMTIDDPLTPKTVRLASNVDSLRFSTNGSSVSMLVTVKVERNQVTLSGSAVPRRIMSFE